MLNQHMSGCSQPAPVLIGRMDTTQVSSTGLEQPMSFTAYPDVNLLLERLLAEMRSCLGDKLVGLYLYGSLVWGDFDTTVSDVDLLAAIRDDLTAEEFLDLQQMHLSMAHSTP